MTAPLCYLNPRLRLRLAGRALAAVALAAGLCVAVGAPAGAATLRPAVSSVSPDTGPLTGGTSITITGAGFTSGATVDIAPAMERGR
jgi:hypothetical protein